MLERKQVKCCLLDFLFAVKETLFIDASLLVVHYPKGGEFLVYFFYFNSSQIVHTFVSNLKTAGFVSTFFSILLILSVHNALGFVCAVKSHPPAESCPGVFLCRNLSLLYTRVKQHLCSKQSLKVEKLSPALCFRFLLQRNRSAAVKPILRTVLISQESQIHLNFHVLYIGTKTLACNCAGFCQ